MKKLPDLFNAVSLKSYPSVNNPVLTGSDVTDMVANYVADPFIVEEKDIYHMFFEIYDGKLGHIGHATSRDGLNWLYNKVVLTDGITHFAYPFVFKFKDIWYMLPDKGESGVGLKLYRSVNFPESWTVDIELITHGNHIDPTPFEWNGKWYILSFDLVTNNTNIHYADSITSTLWTPHPKNPLLNGTYLRPGGRPIVNKHSIDLFIQDGRGGSYGEKTFIYRIIDLTTTNCIFEVSEKPIIEAAKNGGWNSKSMHHVDILFSNRNAFPIAVVDGATNLYEFSIGIYTL
ncbi:glucosamine inositolphosphorylceramide transferase family protein [Priestia megaterium]